MHGSKASGPNSGRFLLQQKTNSYVLDSETEIGVTSKNGKPYVEVTLPRSRGCQVWLDQDYPGYIYPEHITNSLDKDEPAVFVLRYDSDCIRQKDQAQGEQRPETSVRNSIDLYDQVIDSKKAKFKTDFESGKLRIAICRYLDCSPLISYQDTQAPTLIFKSEYTPPKIIDLPLGETKEISKDTLLVEAVYGPPIPFCEAKVRTQPTLVMGVFLPQLPKTKAAEFHEFPEDVRYIYRFYKGNVIDHKKAEELARKGEVFCSLRVVQPKSKSGNKITITEPIDILPFQSLVYASSLAATFYKTDEKDLTEFEYFSRTFEMRSGVTKTGAFLSGGFCSSPHGDQPTGRQVYIRDILENIPGVSFTTNYIPQQVP